ncbi:c-type cytochrome [Thiobacillus denitrificans]|uniref:Cytochrome C n=1 Tax=Thiobacillus denitrificans TaxID=36861 RepID=A0A106BUW2_THIDE|nr:cytochrome c [Thiobacillus denitrificans]KVW98915.1 cytochrome C [Thiobacillus denitrificans]
MKKTLFILAAVALGASLPVHAKGNYEAGKAKSTTCAACHGADGNSTVPSFPKLAGQNRDYLFHSLKDYKSGKRNNPIMAGQVQTLSDADMLDLALYFSKQKGLYLKY